MRDPQDPLAQLVFQDLQDYKDHQALLEIQETGAPQGVQVSQALMACQDPRVPC